MKEHDLILLLSITQTPERVRPMIEEYATTYGLERALRNESINEVWQRFWPDLVPEIELSRVA